MLRITSIIIAYVFILLNCAPVYASPNTMAFDDSTLKEELYLPDWFKLSFLDLQESLDEAATSGKQGIIIYFGRKDCAYCKAQLEVNWGTPDIIQYTQKHFDVIAIDVRGQREVTDFDGKTYPEKDFAIEKNTNFTPTLLFFNTQGQLVLRLPGFRPPYQFRAALEFAADRHYQNEAFRDYMARAEQALSFGEEELNDHDAFIEPPYILDRSKFKAQRPLVVFFEHTKCHACDVLHAGPMGEAIINQSLDQMDVVQLDSHSDTPVITPSGHKTTASKWAEALNLNFAPTLVFFDVEGQEVFRIDSVVRLYRLNNVLNYVLSEGYKHYPTFQIWREQYKGARQ